MRPSSDRTAARKAFGIEPMTLRASFVKAIEDGAEARWKMDTRTVVVNVPPAQAFEPVRRVGGATGWYFGNLLWKARGWVDRRFGGVGMHRGRRDSDGCAVGDVIDGWTVEAYEPDRRLRLSADLKLPGRGWLEFEVTPLDGAAIVDPSDRDLRPARPAGLRVLVRDLSCPRTDLSRTAAADRPARGTRKVRWHSRSCR